MSSESLRLADGRTLSYAELGDPEGRPLLALHGTPGSRLTWSASDAAAAAAGVRLIAPDRPGVGLSSRHPDLTFAAHADDLRQLLDHLDLQSVTLAGASGGGGFALAAASLMPDRIRRLVLACALVPGAPRRTRKGQSGQVRAMFLLARYSRPAVSRLLSRAPATPPGPASPRLERMLSRMPAPDARVVRSELLRPEALLEQAEAFRQGGDAVAHEVHLYGRPSHLDLASIAVETFLLHGFADVNVPFAVAKWASEQIPGARLVEVPDAAHLFLIERPKVLLELVV